MSDKVRPTVAEAVYAFLVVCSDSPDGYQRLDSFIAKLSNDPRWTADEVDEVHLLIVEQLAA